MESRFIYFLLFFSVFLAEIATDIYVPSLPLLSAFFNEDPSLIQWTMSLHLLGFASGQLLYGPLSDYYGKRSLMLFGMALFLFSSVSCAFSPTVVILIISRFAQGIGACVAPVLGLAMLKDLCYQQTHHIRMLSIMSMIISTSPILGPILGTYMAINWGWRSNFLLLGFGGMIVIPLLYFKLRETIPLQNRRQISFSFAQFKPFFSTVPFLCALSINAFIVACVWVFISEGPFICINVYRLPLAMYGFCQAITVCAYILGGLVTTLLISSLGAKKIFNIGLIAMGLGGFGFILVVLMGKDSIQVFIALVALFEFGIGVLRPPLINKIMSFFPSQNGASAAALGVVEMIVSSVCIALLGLFHHDTIVPIALIFSGAALLSFFANYLLSCYVDGKIGSECKVTTP